MRCCLSSRYLVTLHYISDTHLIQDNEWRCVQWSLTRRSVESDAGLERGTISVNYLSSSGSECGLRDVTAAAAAGATTRWTLFQRSRHRHSLQLLAVAARTGNVDVDNRVGLRCKLEQTLIVKSAVSRAGARTWATSSDCNYRASVTLAGARTALARSAPGWEPRPGPGWSRSHRRDLAWPRLARTDWAIKYFPGPHKAPALGILYRTIIFVHFYRGKFFGHEGPIQILHNIFWNCYQLHLGKKWPRAKNVWFSRMIFGILPSSLLLFFIANDMRQLPNANNYFLELHAWKKP